MINRRAIGITRTLQALIGHLQLPFQSSRSFVKADFIQSKGDRWSERIRVSVLGARIIPLYIYCAPKFIFAISFIYSFVLRPRLPLQEIRD
jgi:hypothetical protein